jgi:hypothetical protein
MSALRIRLWSIGRARTARGVRLRSDSTRCPPSHGSNSGRIHEESLDEIDPSDAAGNPDELDGCPLLPPAEFDAAIAALGYEVSFDQRMAVLGADAIELDEADVEYRVLVCGAEVPSEVRSTPGVQLGAVRLPNGIAFADIIAADQEAAI